MRGSTVVSNDRSLMAFQANALEFIDEIVTKVGFDDLEELARKIQGLRAEIDQLEVRACAIAGEQAERMNEPYGCEWVSAFNGRDSR